MTFDYAKARERSILPAGTPIRGLREGTLRRYVAKRCPDCNLRRTVLGQVALLHFERGHVPDAALCEVVGEGTPSTDPPTLHRFADLDSSVDVLAVCACGRPYRAKPVLGKFNPKKECSAKCRSSTGPSCECRCAGLNHGAG